MGDGPGEDRPEHEELAMGDVDDAHDAEDEAEADGGQREDRRHHQALERGEQEKGAEVQGVPCPCNGREAPEVNIAAAAARQPV